MGMRTWLTNLTEAGQVRLLNVQLDKLFKAIGLNDSKTGTPIQDLTKDILNRIHPVGSIFISVDSSNPADLFGGEWERVKDAFLLAAGDVYAAGTEGGEAEHTLTVAEIPSHSHHVRTQGSETAQNALTYTSQKSRLAGAGTLVQNAGGGQPHNNMPPYVAVFIWKRIS